MSATGGDTGCTGDAVVSANGCRGVGKPKGVAMCSGVSDVVASNDGESSAGDDVMSGSWQSNCATRCGVVLAEQLADATQSVGRRW